MQPNLVYPLCDSFWRQSAAVPLFVDSEIFLELFLLKTFHDHVRQSLVILWWWWPDRCILMWSPMINCIKRYIGAEILKFRIASWSCHLATWINLPPCIDKITSVLLAVSLDFMATCGRMVVFVLYWLSHRDYRLDFGYKGLSLMTIFLVHLSKMYVISVSYKGYSDIRVWLTTWHNVHSSQTPERVWQRTVRTCNLVTYSMRIKWTVELSYIG